MSIFKVMQGDFGTDGLVSKHKVFHAETAEACWMHIFDTVMDAEGPYAKFTRHEMLGSWVEEHTDVDDDYSAVRVTVPYPQVKQFDPPPYIIELLARPGRVYDGVEKLRGQSLEEPVRIDASTFANALAVLDAI